jgi:hypothetical protein
VEILIVGGIVVLLMVAASTKIKQAAARAFEPELIEREDFSISKPEGFMSPLEPKEPNCLFEARSREYGEKATKNIWRAHAFLTVRNDLNFKDEREAAVKSAGKVVSERILENAERGEKILLLESERAENKVSTIDFQKTVESRARRKTYVLRISVLPAYRADYIERVNEMINSFRLK